MKNALPWFSCLLVTLGTGCSDTSAATDTAALSSSVTEATAAAETTHAAVRACLDAFDPCVAAAADDAAIAACQATLRACLPQRSAVGDHPLPDLCAAGAPHERPDGGCDHDGGPGRDGDGPHGAAPSDGRGGRDHAGPPVSEADRVALATCHALSDKCLAAGTDSATCLADDHACVDAALKASFDAVCAAIATQCEACPDSARCVASTARCAAGLTLPDPAAATPGA